MTVKVNDKHVLDSPFSIEVNLVQLSPILYFGKEDSSVGMFDCPWGVAVNARDEIAVTDGMNHRVQIFNSDGKYLRSFGRKGNNAGEFKYPRRIAFHKNENVFVADQHNHRIQIFSFEGKYVGMFGGYGRLDCQLINPLGLSVDINGSIIVADTGNTLIKIFSPDGKFLRKVGGLGSFTCPFHCVQCDRYLILSDNEEHCIKVLDRNGNCQYRFGKQGGGEGEFDYPCCLSVNKSGHLMVCDSGNDRIQLFQLNGKFVGKIVPNQGSNLGEFNFPRSLAVLSNGRIVVSDESNHRIQIL